MPRLSQSCPPLGLNKPFACECRGTRFVEWVRYNATNCKLETDPTYAPMLISCWTCGEVYQQTKEWSWEPLPPDSLLL
jgi:hypothetical protein